MSVITISREFGSGGETVARLVSEKLGFLLADHKVIAEGLADYGITIYPEKKRKKEGREESTGFKENAMGYRQALQDYLCRLAAGNRVVILGRGANLLLKEHRPSLHVKVVSSQEKRGKRVSREYGLVEKAALKLIEEQDQKKNRYYEQVFGSAWSDVKAYHMIVNTENLPLEAAAEIIVAAYRACVNDTSVNAAAGAAPAPEETLSAQPSSAREKTDFMHPSEEELAAMLDFYRIRWKYEPRTFALEWDSEGNVLEALTPDFYLPDYDLYLEITTQKQKLGWKKNKKIRRLKELYPQVNIKLINKRGIQSLLQKFSRNQE